jgi:hypothetical protein
MIAGRNHPHAPAEVLAQGAKGENPQQVLESGAFLIQE